MGGLPDPLPLDPGSPFPAGLSAKSPELDFSGREQLPSHWGGL
jgi:hypothetical protein